MALAAARLDPVDAALSSGPHGCRQTLPSIRGNCRRLPQIRTKDRNTPIGLARETSPYLLQHAHNPVDWYPWGEEAFAKAKKEGKLVFLSIGYSSCHWCHVMEHESFENEEVAKILNAISSASRSIARNGRTSTTFT